jgi:biopolymer transport protein TolR
LARFNAVEAMLMLRARSEPNTTPLIDILLVLLVIFTATVPLSQMGIDVEVPGEVASSPAPAAAAHFIVLEYTAGGGVSINRQVVHLVDLAGRLREIYATRTEKTLYISGAPSLPYRRIIDVIEAAKGAGVTRVGIITEGMRRAANLRSTM